MAVNLNLWGIKWGVPMEAIEDLRSEFQISGTYSCSTPSSSEASVQNRIRIEASQKGMRLFRNNVGACTDGKGNFIRYGLANDSSKMNKVIKSSDLIGIRPVKIEEHHLGVTIGQFVAREVKASGWRYTGTDRENAQLKFLELIAGFGGDASFACSTGTL